MQQAKLQEKLTGKLNGACQPSHWLESVGAVRAPALVPGTHIVNHIVKGGTGHHPAMASQPRFFSFMQSQQRPCSCQRIWGWKSPGVPVEVVYLVQNLALEMQRSER